MESNPAKDLADKLSFLTIDHDYQKIATQPKVVAMFENKPILFSDKVKKINQNNWTQERTIVITADKLYNVKGKKIQREIPIQTIGGISRNVQGKTMEFTVHVPSEYDYRFNTEKREDIIKVLQCNVYNLTQKQIPIFDIQEQNLKGFTTTEKDKKRATDRFPLVRFRNKEMDLFFEEEKTGSEAVAQQESREVEINLDADQERRKQQFAETKDMTSHNPEEEDKDDQEIMMSMKPGGQTNPGQAQELLEATLKFKNKKKEDAKLEDFQIIRMVGKGTFGKVFMVQHVKNKQFFAMKCIRKDVVLENENMDSLKLEKEILYTVDHPFIVSMDYVFQNQFRIFFIMDFVEGGELFRHLVKNRRFSEDQAKFMIAQVAIALGHLHDQQIIYRDLKPENVLFKRDGYLLLADFGLATKLDKDKLALSFCGTAEYLSPEMLANKGHDHTVDWWTLGILLYEMIVGIPPFFHKNKHRMYFLIQEASVTFPTMEKHGIYVSPEAQDLINCLLEKKQKSRIGKNGVKEILQHEFFASLDIEKLMKKEVDPPYKPDIVDGEFEFFNSQEQVEMSMLPKDKMKYIKQHGAAFDGF